jgi:hypothetical protein
MGFISVTVMILPDSSFGEALQPRLLQIHQAQAAAEANGSGMK